MSDQFVGRDDKLQHLRHRLGEVGGDSVAKTVLVSGEAGIGKTRLLREFAGVAEASGAHLLQGSCDEQLGATMPYLPLMEALEGFERKHGPGGADVLGGRPYTLLSELIYGTGQAAGAPHQVFAALRGMLDRIGDDAPVVLMFEDLHWADLQTLGLVTALARARPEGRRLLLVGSHRPSHLVRDTPLWGMLSNADFLRRVESLPLSAFSPEELRQFLTVVSDGPVSDEVVRRCMEWSDGVPFHAEELHRAGMLDQDDIEVPATLQEIMMAQVVGATAETRKVLRVAAVAGRRVSHWLLRPVSGLVGDALTAALDACMDRRMLEPETADSVVYRFRHALLRAEMYRRTPTGTRIELHETVADAIAHDPRLSVGERVTADAEVAFHWTQAGRLPDALAASVRAAHVAVRTLAFASAEQQFERVLRLWGKIEQPDDPEVLAGMTLVEVLAATADAARWAGHVKAAVGYVERAIDLVDPGADADLAGYLYERLGNHRWEDEQRTASDAAYERAAGLLTDRPASATKARVIAWQALHHLRHGRHGEGRDTAEAALTMAREVGARAEEGRALNVSGLALGLLDDIDGGVQRLHEALAIAREVHHYEDLFRAYSNLCLVLENGARLTEAASLGREGLAEARQLDLHDSRQGTVLANNVSMVLILLGKWQEAVQVIDDLSLTGQVFPRLTRAEVQVGRGEFDQAERAIAAVAAEDVVDLRFQGPLYALQAEMALWQGRPRVAAERVRRGIEVIRAGENALELLRLCAIGLRAAADLDEAGDDLAIEARNAVKGARTAEIEQLILLCSAERQRRLRRPGLAATWAKVAQGWADLDRRYPAAYARWREAEAALAEGRTDEATEAARAAHATAAALGAAPLRRQVERLAQDARLDLAVRREPPKRPYELTATEFETLRLLYEGLSKPDIAKRRSCSTRTVESHLDRVYRKLGVHSATDALVKARKERLFG
jgi:DNA-binding CsgD family transcriptional regulator